MRTEYPAIPFNLEMSPAERRRLRQYIVRFNIEIQLMTNVFRSLYPDSNIWLFDTNTLFNRVLDDTATYSISSIISNTSGYCEPYGR